MLDPSATSELDARLVEAMARILELDADLERARRSIAYLTAALETNREIGAAIGIVMATRGIDSDGAFALLRRTSQSRHTKVRDVAREVMTTGRLCLPTETLLDGRRGGVR